MAAQDCVADARLNRNYAIASEHRQYILYILCQTTDKRVQRGYKQQLVTPISTMASPERPLSLLALPPEIHTAVLPLRFFDLYTLRLVNKYFYALIPPPVHAELLLAETLDFDFLACVGCTKLRPVATFSSKMFIKKKARADTSA